MAACWSRRCCSRGGCGTTAAGESKVGLLLPASVGGALANLGVSLAGKVPVNLNFTAGRESMAVAIERCGDSNDSHARDASCRRPGIEPLEGMVFLEDVMKEFSGAAKAADAARRAFCCRRGS